MPGLRGVDVPVGRVRDVDFEVSKWEGEAIRSDVRPMRETQILLLCFRPEAELPQQAEKLVAEMPMAANPRPRVANAIMRVVALWIVPTPPSHGVPPW